MLGVIDLTFAFVLKYRTIFSWNNCKILFYQEVVNDHITLNYRSDMRTLSNPYITIIVQYVSTNQWFTKTHRIYHKMKYLF